MLWDAAAGRVPGTAAAALPAALPAFAAVAAADPSAAVAGGSGRLVRLAAVPRGGGEWGEEGPAAGVGAKGGHTRPAGREGDDGGGDGGDGDGGGGGDPVDARPAATVAAAAGTGAGVPHPDAATCLPPRRR